ncbi:hypothetical protein LEMA_P034450.1 [Plenodomus lingam JN3]|uniref:Ubiquitin-like protease family profile domain-containing protein n=1 Tax=Leptosphaeria maculans (strain JN3 / isolate v23.1.3 / race Av1-4-5-6-7-8) TaxID=985895 RepID=E4ZRA6_LEPMJ|nr:hypothetical protein LEMA_P034450.1 [Plenodomus lingam JN3]CBX93771.1 hypothetical protein LEMA_P034450.1 [Plenodomus lingam JN3]
MFKRTFASAFAAISSENMEVTVDSPEQQIQQRLTEYEIWDAHYAQTYPASPPQGTVVGTVKRWLGAAIAFAVPRRFVDRFPQVQQIIAIPVINNEGSLKKRLIDAFGLEEESLSSRAARREAQLQWLEENPSPLTRRLQTNMRERESRFHSPTPLPRKINMRHLPATPGSPDIWSPGFNNPAPQRISPIAFDRITPPGTPILEPESDNEDDDLDISLDFSFSDILTSTPPRNIVTDAPEPINWNSPSIYAPDPHSTHISQPTPVTPVRENLLKQQLRRSAELSDIEEETSFEIAIESVYTPKGAEEDSSDLPDVPSSPFESDIESPISMPKTQTPSSPVQSDAGSSPFQSDADSSPFQSDVDSSPFQSDVGSPTPAPVQTYEDDLSFLVDNSPLPARKTVRWAKNSHVKAFYFDEGVEDMLDSTLESIYSNVDELEMSEELTLETQLLKEKTFVCPLDTKEIDFLEKIAEASAFGQDGDFSIVDDKLKARDFATLLPSMFNGDPKAWLNDNIVNEYLSILVDYKKRDAGFEAKRGGPAPPVHAFSSFWYTNMKKGTESVRRWASRFQLAGVQYLDAELILYPICDVGHWRLIAVKPKARSIEYLDSLGFDGKPYIAKMFEYLKMELKEAFIAEEWSVVEKQRSSRQMNGSDCGVFTLLNALALLRGEEADKVIACDGMLDARERIATTLMAGVPTTEME